MITVVKRACVSRQPNMHGLVSCGARIPTFWWLWISFSGFHSHRNIGSRLRILVTFMENKLSSEGLGTSDEPKVVLLQYDRVTEIDF